MTRRKSTGLHALTGTARPDRQHREPEPMPETLMPDWLPEPAQRLWRVHAPTLSSLGLLSPIDAATFGVWCATQASVEESIAHGRTPGRDQLTSLRALASKFGLDPESRARILGRPPQAPRRAGKFADVDGFADLD